MITPQRFCHDEYVWNVETDFPHFLDDLSKLLLRAAWTGVVLVSLVQEHEPAKSWAIITVPVTYIHKTQL